MKRLLSWLTGALLMASLMAGLVLPSSVYADDDLRSKYSGNEIRNIADDKIAARDGKVDLNNSSVRCLLYTSPSPRDRQKSRMPSSA